LTGALKLKPGFPRLLLRRGHTLRARSIGTSARSCVQVHSPRRLPVASAREMSAVMITAAAASTAVRVERRLPPDRAVPDDVCPRRAGSETRAAALALLPFLVLSGAAATAAGHVRCRKERQPVLLVWLAEHLSDRDRVLCGADELIKLHDSPVRFGIGACPYLRGHGDSEQRRAANHMPIAHTWHPRRRSDRCPPGRARGQSPRTVETPLKVLILWGVARVRRACWSCPRLLAASGPSRLRGQGRPQAVAQRPRSGP
jgi:hypothetical protein